MVGRRFRWLAILIFILSSPPCNADTEAAPPPDGIHAIIHLKNGSKMEGYLTALSVPKNLVQIFSDENMWTFKLDEIVSIRFSDGDTSSVERTNTIEARPQENTPSTGNLSIEAAIVYKYDGVKPVARTGFYLLSVDPAEILRRLEWKYHDGELVKDVYSHVALFARRNDLYGKELTQTQNVLKNASIQSVTTDFNGRASFEPITSGKYYLFGLAETRAGFCVWSLPILIKFGENVLILDQNNTVYAD